MAMARLGPTMLVLSVICGSASGSAEVIAGLPPEAELIALCDAWIDAEVRGDRGALERILHEDFLITYPSGRTADRTAFIDGIVNSEIAPFKVLHEFIRVHGDTALVIDASEDGHVKFTWVAVRNERGWRVISETVSRVASP